MSSGRTAPGRQSGPTPYGTGGPGPNVPRGGPGVAAGLCRGRRNRSTTTAAEANTAARTWARRPVRTYGGTVFPAYTCHRVERRRTSKQGSVALGSTTRRPGVRAPLEELAPADRARAVRPESDSPVVAHGDTGARGFADGCPLTDRQPRPDRREQPDGQSPDEPATASTSRNTRSRLPPRILRHSTAE